MCKPWPFGQLDDSLHSPLLKNGHMANPFFVVLPSAQWSCFWGCCRGDLDLLRESVPAVGGGLYGASAVLLLLIVEVRSSCGVWMLEALRLLVSVVHIHNASCLAMHDSIAIPNVCPWFMASAHRVRVSLSHLRQRTRHGWGPTSGVTRSRMYRK